MTMEHGPVRFRTAGIMMPLHHSLISLSLRNTDHIHPVALLKYINPNGLSYFHIANLLKLPQDTGGWCCRLLQMPQFSLGQLAVFHFAKRQLDRFIPITLFCPDRDDATGTCLDDSHRRKPCLVKYLGHPQFLTQQPVRHAFRSLSVLFT